jgi:aspartate/methionine/tyrosine aminotransferase
MMKIAQRAQRIEPFYVMEVAKAAAERAALVAHTDTPMIFLNIGEPDFTAPPLVQEAAARAVHDGVTQYTPALGIPELRERISAWYSTRFGVNVQLACLALIEAGDEVLMPDPSYPCNRHFVSAAEGRAVLVPTTAAERFQLSAEQVRANWTAHTRGVLLASPSNPTGTSIHPDELRAIHREVSQRGGTTLIDEIYLGLSYDAQFGQSALGIDDQIISIKYFNMTGWRLGWLVVPDALVPVVERLAQNLFICASTVAQHAALACFEAESIAEFERRRAEFKARRDFFVPALNALGLDVPVMPDGAFYAWADCTTAAKKLGVNGSWDFAFEVMNKANLAITPGRDFGHADTSRFVRFSTARSLPELQTAIGRLHTLLG